MTLQSEVEGNVVSMFDSTGSSSNYRFNHWLNQCYESHGNRFDYSMVEYKSQNHKVTIICPVHGLIIVRPADHVRTKHGCNRCGAIAGVSTATVRYTKNGITHLQRAAIKSNSLRNNEQRSIAGEKARLTRIQKGDFVPDHLRTPWKLYQLQVSKYSRRSVKLLDKPTNTIENDPYELDHIYSKYDGFRNNIDPKIIGHVENLRYIPRSKNRSKNHKSDITILDLLKKVRPNDITE